MSFPENSQGAQNESEPQKQRDNPPDAESPKDGKSEPFGCKICGVKFLEKKYLELHMKNRHPICPVCMVQTKTIEGLIQHLKAKHMGNDEQENVEEFGYFDSQEYLCPECQMVFDNEMNLINHRINKHNFKPFECEFCGEAFYNKRNLIRHKKLYHETQIEDPEDLKKLDEELQDDSEPAKHILTDEQYEERLEILKTGNAKRREKIIRSLIKNISEDQKKKILDIIIQGKENKDFISRLLMILIKTKYEPVKHQLWQLAQSDNLNLRYTAIRGLGKFKMKEYSTTLIERLREKDLDFDEFAAIVSALSYMESEEALEIILNFANSPDWKKRRHVAKSLENIYHCRSISTLRYFLFDSNEEVRKFALSALQTIEKMLNQQKLLYIEKHKKGDKQEEYPFQEILELTQDILEDIEELEKDKGYESESVYKQLIYETDKQKEKIVEIQSSITQFQNITNEINDDGFEPLTIDQDDFQEFEPIKYQTPSLVKEIMEKPVSLVQKPSDVESQAQTAVKTVQKPSGVESQAQTAVKTVQKPSGVESQAQTAVKTVQKPSGVESQAQTAVKTVQNVASNKDTPNGKPPSSTELKANPATLEQPVLNIFSNSEQTNGKQKQDQTIKSQLSGSEKIEQKKEEAQEKEKDAQKPPFSLIAEKDIIPAVTEGMKLFKSKVLTNAEKVIILDSHDIMCGFLAGEPNIKKLLNATSYFKARNMNYYIMLEKRDIPKIEAHPEYKKLESDKILTISTAGQELLTLISLALYHNGIIITNRSFVRYKNQDYNLDEFISKRIITYVFINDAFVPDKQI